MELVRYPHKSLTTNCSLVTEIDQGIQEFADQLEKLCYDRESYGVAAPQVGVNKRIFVLMLNNVATTCINPVILEFRGNKTKTREGCLSIPGIAANLNSRNDYILLLYVDKNGQSAQRELMGGEAIAAQHEMDHLNGITLFERMGVAQRHLKLNKYRKLCKKDGLLK